MYLLNRLHHIKFWPPFVLLSLTILFSISRKTQFLAFMQSINSWILTHFSWLFSWSAVLVLLLLGIIYFSPISSIKIGGKNAKPILTKWKWFSITICTTIATGLLFWGTAEPLMHLNNPPEALNLVAGSKEARNFAMSAMLMHWTITPYGIYTIAGLVFAISYYNLKQPFQVGSLVYPIFGKYAQGPIGTATDIICLYALIAGMSASLGAGILTLAGGLSNLFDISRNQWVMGIIGSTIVITFIISAASGLMKGIRILSDYNVRIFFLIALIFLLFSPLEDLINITGSGGLQFVSTFLPHSVNWDNHLGKDWFQSWTVFNWANWLAWTPITALFLGRISVGYTIKQYIHVNLLLPALFGSIWIVIFSGNALHSDIQLGGEIYKLMQANGPESAIYALIEKMPFHVVIGAIFLIATFISYVTAADSNTSAMSGICTKGITPDHPESPIGIKVIWGIIIAVIAWVMITYAGIDGIKIISVLGGFPALFILLFIMAGAIKMLIISPDYRKLNE